jgi:hypothetical protein
MKRTRQLAAHLAVITALLAVAPTTDAQETNRQIWMSREEIVAAFVDQQLSGVYPSGMAWRELIRSDGTSDYREGEAQRTGRWLMRGDQFCFTYALPHSGGCFLVVRLGQNCYELYAVGAGGGAEPPPPTGAERHWNGRMWREDSAATCDEKPTV